MKAVIVQQMWEKGPVYILKEPRKSSRFRAQVNIIEGIRLGVYGNLESGLKMANKVASCHLPPSPRPDQRCGEYDAVMWVLHCWAGVQQHCLIVSVVARVPWHNGSASGMLGVGQCQGAKVPRSRCAPLLGEGRKRTWRSYYKVDFQFMVKCQPAFRWTGLP